MVALYQAMDVLLAPSMGVCFGIPCIECQACGVPVIFDGTHSVQQPGKGQGGASGGLREHIPALTYAACAAGADGLFLETHPDPNSAPSDGPNMLPLSELDAVITKAVGIWELARG
jgi:2-dehydro-3-deoxyphosphooctonate aldolase (KDO 8-P synthase)